MAINLRTRPAYSRGQGVGYNSPLEFMQREEENIAPGFEQNLYDQQSQQSPAGEDTPASLLAQQTEAGMGVPQRPPPPLARDEMLGEDFTDEELAAARQDPYLANTLQRSEAVTDASGRAQYDENGQIIEAPITRSQFQDQSANALNQRPDLSGALNAEGGSSTGFANSVIANRELVMKTGYANDAREARRKAETMSSTLGYLTDLAETHVMSSKSLTKVDDGNGNMIPEGIMSLYKAQMLTPEAKKGVSTLLGVSMASAFNQTAATDSVPGDSPFAGIGGEGASVDSQPLSNIVNAATHSLRNAMDKTGIQGIDGEAARRMASAMAIGLVNEGKLIKTKDSKGNEVYAPSGEMKVMSRELSYLAEALAEDTRRSTLAKTPTSQGASDERPGSTTTSKDIRNDEMIDLAARITKDILGGVKYIYLPKDVLFKQVQLEDITSKMVDDDLGPTFSTSIYANTAGVGEQSYKNAMIELKYPAGYNSADPVAKSKEADRRRRHAAGVIQDKLKAYARDIEFATPRNPETGEPDFTQPLVSGYKSYIHSAINQRFYEATRGADAMSSKWAVREMLNFVKQDAIRPASLFDSKEVQRLKNVGRDLFRTVGVARQRLMEKVIPGDLAAIALMVNVAVNHETINGRKAALKTSEAGLLDMYNTEMADSLASLGKEFNAYMADPQGTTHDNIKGYLAAVPKGESLGNKNLWDDVFNLKQANLNPAIRSIHVPMTHVVFDDGNQNGIFLQSLFFGKKDVSRRLGLADPTQLDMREYASNVIETNITDILKDKPEAKQSWLNALAKLKENDKFASDFFKIPMMQNSYSKDAGMFGDHVFEFVTSDAYQQTFIDYLVGEGKPYKSTADVADALNLALEKTLREVVAQKDGQMMMMVGRYFASTNHVPMVRNINGDHVVIVPSSLMNIRDKSKDVTDEAVGTRTLGSQTDEFRDAEGNLLMEIPVAQRGYNPSYAKPQQKFYDKNKNEWSSFENYKGSALARQYLVMSIQAADGGLLSLMSMAVNNNTKSPRPVSVVHDAINTTGSSSLFYRNAYNNIAIPMAIKEIAKFGEKTKEQVIKARQAALKFADQNGAIGIHDDGDFPAMGALFDEWYEKLQEGGEYQLMRFTKMGYDPSFKGQLTADQNKARIDALKWWKRFNDRYAGILEDASKSGWTPPGYRNMPEQARAKLFVTSSEFRRLINLTENLLGISGPVNADFDKWVQGFSQKVLSNGKELQEKAATMGGIWQMSPAGGKMRKDIAKKQEAKADKDFIDIPPELGSALSKETGLFNVRVLKDDGKSLLDLPELDIEFKQELFARDLNSKPKLDDEENKF